MEQNKFNKIVDILLEKRPKDYIIELRRSQRKSLNINFDEDSLRLAPIKVLDKCGECGIDVAGRVVHIKKRAIGTPKEHWEHKCISCKKVKKIKSLHEK
jgi:hypothetical protein